MIYDKEEMVAAFNRNFDIEAYNKVKKELLEQIGRTHTLDEFCEVFDEYDGLDDDPDIVVFTCEKELDRSRMETDADYVSVEFWFEYIKSTGKVNLWRVGLYTTECDYGISCYFNPDTLEIIEWY